MSSRNQVKLIDDKILQLIKQQVDNCIFHHEYRLYPRHLEAIENQIPKNIINDIRNKNTTFCLNLSGEAEFYFVDNIYEQLVVKHNIPESQILLVCSSPDYKDYIIKKANYYNKNPIRSIYISIFEHLHKQLFLWYMLGVNDLNILDKVIPYKSSLHNDHFNKKFLCFNRRWKEHRFAMLSLLKSKDLIQHGHISFSKNPVNSDDLYYGDNDAFEKMCKDTVNKYTDIKEILEQGFNFKNDLPLILDNKVFETYFAYDSSHRPLLKYFKDTYFSLVNETLFENGNVRFLTEKLFKPIMHKHPFVLVSTPFSLQMLRDQGYQTFDGIIDESYDKELDDAKRLILLASEVDRLCNLNKNELNDFKIRCLPIVEHNYNTFFTKQIELTHLT